MQLCTRGQKQGLLQWGNPRESMCLRWRGGGGRRPKEVSGGRARLVLDIFAKAKESRRSRVWRTSPLTSAGEKWEGEPAWIGSFGRLFTCQARDAGPQSPLGGITTGTTKESFSTNFLALNFPAATVPVRTASWRTCFRSAFSSGPSIDLGCVTYFH